MWWVRAPLVISQSDTRLLPLLFGIWGDYDDEYFKWQQSLSNYCLLGAMLNALFVFSHLNLTTSLRDRICFPIFQMRKWRKTICIKPKEPGSRVQAPAIIPHHPTMEYICMYVYVCECTCIFRYWCIISRNWLGIEWPDYQSVDLENSAGPPISSHSLDSTYQSSE